MENSGIENEEINDSDLDLDEETLEIIDLTEQRYYQSQYNAISRSQENTKFTIESTFFDFSAPLNRNISYANQDIERTKSNEKATTSSDNLDFAKRSRNKSLQELGSSVEGINNIFNVNGTIFYFFK
ncbi:hypothetical protein BB560_002751 [Smittium megazygosporum]|uniref:Uncharacterized protein n=1 Tax=Smittium megazygosporum TaxID=133381 RepID=A0A2T9ZDV9_9FUNG|nr:hypothetical protein BB560_002751 [Smittium megazygosporum]